MGASKRRLACSKFTRSFFAPPQLWGKTVSISFQSILARSGFSKIDLDMNKYIQTCPIVTNSFIRGLFVDGVRVNHKFQYVISRPQYALCRVGN